MYGSIDKEEKKNRLEEHKKGLGKRRVCFFLKKLIDSIDMKKGDKDISTFVRPSP